MHQYLPFVACHTCMTAAVLVTGRAMHRAVGRASEARRVHGRYVLVWAVAGYAAGPVAAVLAFEGQPRGGVPEAAFASWVFGMFALLAGWTAGTLHGGLVLAVRARRPGTNPTPGGV